MTSANLPTIAHTRLRARLERRTDIGIHPTDALGGAEPPGDAHFHRPGEVLVASDTDQTALFRRVASELGIGIRVHEDDGGVTTDIGVTRYQVDSPSNLEDVLKSMEEHSGHRLQVTPNHVLFANPVWGMEPFGDPSLPAPGPPPTPSGGGAGVTVAVVDTGLPAGFGANLLLQGIESPPDEEEPWTYSGADRVLVSPQGHGSFVAGVVRQVASEATVRSFRVLDDDGVADEWTLGHQLALVLQSGARVINLSLGATTRRDQSLMGLAALRAAALGTGPDAPIVVAAAGNQGQDRPFYPAADDWVIGVGAVGPGGAGDGPVRADFSNFGPWVDTWALGVDVLSSYEANAYRSTTSPDDIIRFEGFARWSGTSFAAPRVSGAIATLLSTDGGVSRADVLARLTAHALAVDVDGLGCYVS